MRINSFSAFGQARSQYLSLMPLLVRQHHTFYPAWKFYIITDRPFSNDEKIDRFVNKMCEMGLINVVVRNSGSFADKPISGVAMLWRLSPIWFENSEYVSCRDLDSIFTPRQLKYVLAFINSGMAVHGINDNAGHTISLMGGMTSFKSEKFKQITKFSNFEEMLSLSGRNDLNHKGTDQTFMMNHLWFKIRNNFLLHKPEGPNERYMLKDCVDGVDTSYLSKEVLQYGDEFTNYIGAVGLNGKASFEKVCEFFDKHGNVKICETIIKAEEQL